MAEEKKVETEAKTEVRAKTVKKDKTQAFIERKLKAINSRADGARKEKSVARLMKNKGVK